MASAQPEVAAYLIQPSSAILHCFLKCGSSTHYFVSVLLPHTITTSPHPNFQLPSQTTRAWTFIAQSEASSLVW